MNSLPKASKVKRLGKLTKGVLFYQENARAYKSVVAKATVHDCSFTLLATPLIHRIQLRQTIFCFRK